MARDVRGGSYENGYQVTYVPTDLVHIGPFRTRGDDSATEGLAELAASIAGSGMIEPIVVRRREDGEFDVIAGERRLRATRQLGLADVPCIVRECSDGEALSIALVENLQRLDLNPVERAMCIHRLVEEFAITQQEVGKRVGMSQSSVAHHLKLLTLPEPIRRFIEDGTLSMGHAKVLSRMADGEYAVALAKWCIQEKQTVRQLEAQLDRQEPSEAQAADAASCGRPKQLKEPRELANGIYLVIRENADGSRAGKIEVPYYSQDERDWVLKALGR